MNRILKIAGVMLLCSLFSACGQRGPLYLPEEAPANKDTSKETSQVTDEEQNDSDVVALTKPLEHK